MVERYEAPPIDAAIDEALQACVAKRTRNCLMPGTDLKSCAHV
jgi:trimethylamine:corrinoid methyltransferase-like protein